MQPDSPWTRLLDDLTPRHERHLHGFRLTVSRALYRWWWTIADERGIVDQSEPQFEEAEAAMHAAEEVAGVYARVKEMDGR